MEDWKLLIVDDQLGVVQGLLHGIPWRTLGIGQVYTALNAVDAKAWLQSEYIDIMLCDIEMPVENGLELLQWARSQGIQTQCIFLTAHAEFNYAQEALRLGSFDYILQPASYTDVKNAVLRAIEEIRKSQNKDELYQISESFKQENRGIALDILKAWLQQNNANSRSYEAFEQHGILPQRDRPGYLICLSILRWKTTGDRWDISLLVAALDNVLQDIFGTRQTASWIVPVSDRLFAIFLQAPPETGLEDPMLLANELRYFMSVCQNYIHCTVAMYFDDPVHCSAMPQLWTVLENRDRNNVARTADIYYLQNQKNSEYRYRTPQLRYWVKLLSEGESRTVETEANEMLDRMQQMGGLNADVLHAFYQDFLQTVYLAAGSTDTTAHELFQSKEDYLFYQNGTCSLADMKILIHRVAEVFANTEADTDPAAAVEKAKNYIADHMEKEIWREDIAAYVHLNADYLNRIFKKAEGTTLKEYIITRKMELARNMLRSTRLSVSIIAARVGFINSSHFSATYKKHFGVTPLDDRKDAAAEKGRNV